MGVGETSAQSRSHSLWRRLATAQEAGLVLVIALLMALLTVLGGLPTYAKPKDATFIPLPAGVVERVDDGLLVLTTDSDALACAVAAELPESKDGNLAIDKFKKDMESEETKQAVAADIKQANDLGLNGTPFIWVNGRMLPFDKLGGNFLQEFEQWVKLDIELAGQTPAAPTQKYQQMMDEIKAASPGGTDAPEPGASGSASAGPAPEGSSSAAPSASAAASTAPSASASASAKAPAASASVAASASASAKPKKAP